MATATGAWSWLNDLAAYDTEKNKTLPNVQTKKTAPVVVKETAKSKPKVLMDEAAKQRVAMGLSVMGFGSFYTDRPGRNDQKGVSATGVKIGKPVVLGRIDPLKPGGLTASAGLTAVGLQQTLSTGKPIGTVLR